ncbi:Ribonuclease P subunit, Rpr2/Snm1/Rpp21 [Dillenia turbinata]|uniref:Ribonuclease P subunit, Rpr2/Snm1/Rpp21 n=1 Tax=Dillenia turbinata TaxID=194707 RepID=A0AAN8V798_9MAGN
MGRGRGKTKGGNTVSGIQHPVTMRQEAGGRMKHVTNHNPKVMLKMDHLQKLAVWASGEASLPSLGALFGHRLAALGESLGVPTVASLFSCQRCESILQPGYNCIICIEANKAKARRHNKASNKSAQNNVVYTCGYCSHRNMKRGTPRGYIKEICPPKAKSSSDIKCLNATSKKPSTSKGEVNEMEEMASPTLPRDAPAPVTNSPTTSSVSRPTSLLDRNKRRRKRSGPKKSDEHENDSATGDAEQVLPSSKKRRRKSWTSLKEIAEQGEHDNCSSITNFTIPFLL